MDLFGMSASTPQPSRGQGSGKKGRGQRRQGGAPAQDDLGLNAEEQQGLQLMTRIREDLAASKVQDVVLQPSSVRDLNVVVALAQEFLPEGAIDNLLSGDFSVLGKVTRIVENNDEISLYQRTVFRNLESDSLDEVFDKLRESGVFELSEHPSHIEAPALQLMPLAIYA
jgi:hypothetical protein